MRLRWIFSFAFAAMVSPAFLYAQDSAEDFEKMLNDGAKGLVDPTLPMEHPAPLDSGAKDGIRFYFTSLVPPGDLNLFVKEGKGYLPIRAAYDTFGSMHRLSRRSDLILCEKVIREVEGEEETIYQPLFSTAVPKNTSPFVAVLQPMGKRQADKVYPLRTISLSPTDFPFGMVTLFNPFNHPIYATIDETKKVIPAYQTLHHPYKIRRNGAGYVHIQLGRKTAEGMRQKILLTRIAMFEGSRGIGLPCLDSSGAGGLALLVHREAPPEAR